MRRAIPLRVDRFTRRRILARNMSAGAVVDTAQMLVTAGDVALAVGRFETRYLQSAWMHILMIAPEPFFEPRGTPFSEYHRIRALADLGHTVDLVTYPFGQNVTMAGLRVFRSWRVPFLTRVRIGPSLAKIPLDALLTLTAARRALSARYDAVHSHEEGGVIGVILAALLRVPHV